MTLRQNNEIITLKCKESEFRFLESGDVFEWRRNDLIINQLLGNALDGSINNLYLRVYKDNEMKVAPLLGIKSNSKFYKGENKVVYNGTFENIEYEVTFTLAEDTIYFYDVKIKGNGVVDVVYGQDISIASIYATQANELYVSQYIDHKVLTGEFGTVICSRQNQKQGGGNPYLQLGSLNTKVVSYCTDGMQFFGKQYKKTNQPIVMTQDLPNEKYQYELSYIGLQTEKIHLDGEQTVTFYGCFKTNHADAVETIEYTDEIKKAYDACKDEECTLVKGYNIRDDFDGNFVSEEFTTEELNEMYPNQKFVETKDDVLLSFFTNDHDHVVTQAKEMLVERTHGHIITSGMDLHKINSELITSTNYITGIFESQVVVGNTNLNKLTSTPRSPLNTMKNSGLRIYVKLDGKYQLLTLPAVYELGVNHARWIYKINDDRLVITSYTAKNASDIVLDVKATNEYEFILTNQLNMACDEFRETIEMERNQNTLIFTPSDNTFLKNTYPNISYKMRLDGVNFHEGSDEILYDDGATRNGTLLTLTCSPTASFTMTIEGNLEGKDKENVVYDFEEEKEKFHELYQTLTNNFHIQAKESTKYNLDKLNETVWWYTHNAMTHYAVPHGLEQPGGAAWGTRDICQGPFEYFEATQKYELNRAVLLEIFAHQFKETGEWPQWFMFDRYCMQQDDSHGDVVFWPLKILGDYLHISEDASVLDEVIAYRHFPSGEIIEGETLFAHLERALVSIEHRFIQDTHLITYAGGDWDDTLQPASPELKEKLVSAWTMGLAYQSIKQLGEVLSESHPKFSQKCLDYAKAIHEDFEKYLIHDEVIAGFAKVENKDDLTYMLHPSDTETGIHYRLLPMTRSIIAQMVSCEQANKNVALIDEYLKCEDGVRLMDQPAQYTGGVSKIFQRAEQASNVGREISLQYVHAHIRYIEAMAKLGLHENTWEAMFKILPMNIQEHVKNANIRQSNCYFSSSEGDFKDRYEYKENFSKLRNGDIPVKAGWRIYSSGPGIYLNQIISNVLGLRVTKNTVDLDPVLTDTVKELEIQYQIYGKDVTIQYHTASSNNIKEVKINGHLLPICHVENKYREAGVQINAHDLKEHLNDQNNILEITLD